MAWVVDQEEIAAPLEEQTFGDSQISLVTIVPIAAGAWVFVNLSSYGNESIASISDDGPSLTWVVVQGISSENANQRVAIARAFAPAGMSSGTTITAAWTGNDIAHKWIGGISFTGGDADSFDSVVATLSENSTAFSTNPVTTIEDDELIICTGQAGQAFIINGTPPSIEYLDEHAPGGGTAFYAFYRMVGIPGTYTIAGLITNPIIWVSIAISMRLAGPPPQKLRPDADIDIGGWTSGPLFSKIDEDVADGLIITATSS